MKKELKKEKFFTAVQIGRNAILLCGISPFGKLRAGPPAKNAPNAVRFWLKQKGNKSNVQIKNAITKNRKFELTINLKIDNFNKICRSGGIALRAEFKILWEKSHEGWTPSSGTILNYGK